MQMNCKESRICLIRSTAPQLGERESEVGAVTRHGPNVPWFKRPWRQKIFCSPHSFTPAQEPTLPPVKWVPGLFTAGKEAEA